MTNQTKSARTMKKSLTEFFLLLVSLSILLCLFNLIFNAGYNRKYQTIIQQMTSIHEYYDSLDQLYDNLRLYSHYGDEQYYKNASDYKTAANQSLKNITASNSSRLIRQETDDLSEMTAYLAIQMEELHAVLQESQESGSIDTLRELTQKNETIEHIYAAINSEYKDCNYRIITCIAQTYRNMQTKSRCFLAAFFLLFFAICFIVMQQIHRLTQDTYRPIYTLTCQARQIRNGDLRQTQPVTVPPNTDLEIRTLSEVFNEMVSKMKEQLQTMEENIRIRQLLSESRYKELQLQINPHFLFNTLNMISECAYLENARMTENLLVSAAKMFRFSLDFSGKIITLDQEMRELKNYIFIQEQRFGERISFQIEYDEKVGSVKIPSFILQPLVENAIIHGIGQTTENARISIKASCSPENGTVYLTVSDNGCGMDEKKLSEVRYDMEHADSQSMKIGLGNVWLRLNFYTDHKAQIQLESRPGTGTKVTISLPQIPEERTCIN